MSTLKTSQAAPAVPAFVFDANAPRCQDLGICATCNHQASCLFLKAARHPIAFCEEFDASGQAADPRPSAQSAPRPDFNFGEGQEQGLCADCATKAGCINRQPGSAVWNCEDYH
jgi:hypothetical protein